MSSFSVLSCLHCRSRKVKCDRTLPSCNRCNAASHPCVYRSRQPRERKSKKNNNDRPAGPADTFTQDTLALIWERLGRIEQNARRQEASALPDTPSFESPFPGSSALNASTGNSPQLTHHPYATPAESHNPSAFSRDIEATLNKAVSETRILKNKQLAASTGYLFEDVSIPKETAKKWVSNFFSSGGSRFWPALKDESTVDFQLLHLMPDLLQMKHVHIDACMVVIYYCVLWEGHFVINEATNRISKPDPLLERNLYFGCLRAVSTWHRQASGSVIDFIAATMMAQVAVENFDTQLCWDMHACACTWSEALELHSSDSTGATHHSLLSATDSGRMSMWKLVHVELLFRLVLKKDAAFSFDLSQWRVNLPFLLFDEEMDSQGAIPATAFLAGSRVTLVLIRFFQVLQEDLCWEDRISSVVSLCEQVEEAVQEWDIFDWHQSYKLVKVDGWYLSELALSCYSSIFFMLRSVTGNPDKGTPQYVSPRSRQAASAKPISLRASRRIIIILNHMIQVIGLPGSLTLPVALGLYSSHVAYANIVQHVLDEPTDDNARDDVAELMKFGNSIQTLASEASEYVPIARALACIETQMKRGGVSRH